jgi:hypothetical protein
MLPVEGLLGVQLVLHKRTAAQHGSAHGAQCSASRQRYAGPKHKPQLGPQTAGAAHNAHV